MRGVGRNAQLIKPDGIGAAFTRAGRLNNDRASSSGKGRKISKARKKRLGLLDEEETPQEKQAKMNPVIRAIIAGGLGSLGGYGGGKLIDYLRDEDSSLPTYGALLGGGAGAAASYYLPIGDKYGTKSQGVAQGSALPKATAPSHEEGDVVSEGDVGSRQQGGSGSAASDSSPPSLPKQDTYKDELIAGIENMTGEAFEPADTSATAVGGAVDTVSDMSLAAYLGVPAGKLFSRTAPLAVGAEKLVGKTVLPLAATGQLLKNVEQAQNYSRRLDKALEIDEALKQLERAYPGEGAGAARDSLYEAIGGVIPETMPGGRFDPNLTKLKTDPKFVRRFAEQQEGPNPSPEGKAYIEKAVQYVGGPGSRFRRLAPRVGMDLLNAAAAPISAPMTTVAGAGDLLRDAYSAGEFAYRHPTRSGWDAAESGVDLLASNVREKGRGLAQQITDTPGGVEAYYTGASEGFANPFRIHSALADAAGQHRTAYAKAWAGRDEADAKTRAMVAREKRDAGAGRLEANNVSWDFKRDNPNWVTQVNWSKYPGGRLAFYKDLVKGAPAAQAGTLFGRDTSELQPSQQKWLKALNVTYGTPTVATDVGKAIGGWGGGMIGGLR